MRSESIETPMGMDHYLFMSAGEIPEAYAKHGHLITNYGGWGGDTRESFKQKIVTGDTSLVAEVDKFLSKIEDQMPVSRGWRNIDDVVGAVPNVPAFLAGHPQCMRRRTHVAKDTAPLAIYMDLTSSGGIAAAKVERRGVVLLALARLLVEHRAVELWVGAALGGPAKVSSTVAWRIDTTPLDLARAAYHIGSTAMSRCFGYGLTKMLGPNSGAWPFNSYDKHCATAEARLRVAMAGGGTELMFIPPIMQHDPLTDDPVGWLKRVMKQYVGTEEAE